jgi:DNA-binding HxlR family transcriptional regulator
VRRNPGYGHPLRPEYLLSAKGEALGPMCDKLDRALTENGLEDLGLRKWPLPILYVMAHGPKASRFSEILSALRSLTPRSLSESLKRMEEAGWIAREVTNEFPPSTRYAVTAIGSRYQTLVEALAKVTA